MDLEVDRRIKRRGLDVKKFFNVEKKYIKKKDRGKRPMRLLGAKLSIKQAFASSKYPYIRFSTFAANEIYKTIWIIMLERSVFEFCDALIGFNDVSKNLTCDLFNFKHIIEFFL